MNATFVDVESEGVDANSSRDRDAAGRHGQPAVVDRHSAGHCQAGVVHGDSSCDRHAAPCHQHLAAGFHGEDGRALVVQGDQEVAAAGGHGGDLEGHVRGGQVVRVSGVEGGHGGGGGGAVHVQSIAADGHAAGLDVEAAAGDGHAAGERSQLVDAHAAGSVHVEDGLRCRGRLDEVEFRGGRPRRADLQRGGHVVQAAHGDLQAGLGVGAVVVQVGDVTAGRAAEAVQTRAQSRGEVAGSSIGAKRIFCTRKQK